VRESKQRYNNKQDHQPNKINPVIIQVFGGYPEFRFPKKEGRLERAAL
jgi:hypothetical protein